MSTVKCLCRNTKKLQSNIQPNFGEILFQKHCILVVKICISKEFFDSAGKENITIINVWLQTEGKGGNFIQMDYRL